jgi:hypothetical protein
MFAVSLQEVATGLARHVREQWSFVPRGSVPVRLVDDTDGPVRIIEDGTAVVGVFGNDNYLMDARARCEVELIRKRLHEMDAEEVGFGLSADGYTWALLVRVNEERYQTLPGKVLQKELLKIFLGDAVSRAWNLACGNRTGVLDGEPPVGPIAR